MFYLYIVASKELFYMTNSLPIINERFFPFNVLPKLFTVPILLFEAPLMTPDIGRFICAVDFVWSGYS